MVSVSWTIFRDIFPIFSLKEIDLNNDNNVMFMHI